MKGKRWAGMAAALLACVLTGCALPGNSGTQTAPPSEEAVSEAVRQPFDAAATIKMGGIEAEADLNKTEDGVYTFRFTQPKTLDGMTITMKEETIGLSYLGLSVEADSEKVLNSSMTKAVVSAINKAAEPNGITVGTEGSAITVSGKTDAGDFTLTLDQKNQSILTLSIPNLDLECHFGGR